VSENQEQKGGRRWGVNRWIVLALIIASAYAASLYPPLQPHVQLPAENISHNPLFVIPGIGEVFFTNTMMAVLIAVSGEGVAAAVCPRGDADRLHHFAGDRGRQHDPTAAAVAGCVRHGEFR